MEICSRNTGVYKCGADINIQGSVCSSFLVTHDCRSGHSLPDFEEINPWQKDVYIYMCVSLMLKIMRFTFSSILSLKLILVCILNCHWSPITWILKNKSTVQYTDTCPLQLYNLEKFLNRIVSVYYYSKLCFMMKTG